MGQNLCLQALRRYADWINLKKNSWRRVLDPLPSLDFFLGARTLAFPYTFECYEIAVSGDDKILSL
jgi:hypothetical protein